MHTKQTETITHTGFGTAVSFARIRIVSLLISSTVLGVFEDKIAAETKTGISQFKSLLL